MSDVIRVMVVDDHPVVRKGIIAMLETEPDMTVVGECSSGEQAVETARRAQPNVILMDLVMPGIGGIEAIRQIKQNHPKIQVLVLTSFTGTDQIMPSLSAGATGYLLKDSDPMDLLKAIRKLNSGEGYLHPLVTRELLNRVVQPPEEKHAPEADLTERELEVMRLIARGLSNAEIARELVVTEATVHTHVNKIFNKLRLNSRTQVALYALRKGIAALDEAA